MKIKKKQQRRKKTLTLLSMSVVLMGVCIYGTYWYTTSQSTTDTDNSSLASSAKGDPIDPTVEERVKGGGGSGQGQQSAPTGGVVDTGGKNVTSQSGGVSSQSGNITLYSPVPNQKVTGTIAVKGAAKTSVVYYRINDNVSGMIGSGQLLVNNGFFSGTLAANTTATKGSFEVYSFDSHGREIDNLSVELQY